MKRVRLREAHQDVAGFYSGRYPEGYRHDRWPDHVERIKASREFIRAQLPWVRSVADLSAGDGALALSLLPEVNEIVLGDLNGVRVDPYMVDGPVFHRPFITGPLPDTLDRLPIKADLYICSETLEHLDDPDGFLFRLRPHAHSLFVSTPEGEEGDGNHEHYWGWDHEAVEVMLRHAGWQPVAHEVFVPKSADVYRFQFWACV